MLSDAAGQLPKHDELSCSEKTDYSPIPDWFGEKSICLFESGGLKEKRKPIIRMTMQWFGIEPNAPVGEDNVAVGFVFGLSENGSCSLIGASSVQCKSG